MKERKNIKCYFITTINRYLINISNGYVRAIIQEKEYFNLSIIIAHFILFSVNSCRNLTVNLWLNYVQKRNKRIKYPNPSSSM